MKSSSRHDKKTSAADLTDEDCPALARGVRIGNDPVTAEPVLLFPEGVLPLDQSTHDIVGLCDGNRTVETIIRSLADIYEIEPDALRSSVLDCILQLRRLLLIATSQPRPPSEHSTVSHRPCTPPQFRYRPFLLLAELTYRCPLHCPYCSNPASYPTGGELSTADWCRVLLEAADIGILHVGFSGGEPLLRTDLAQLIHTAREAGLYTNLITSALGLNSHRAEELKSAGLDSVQISLQSDEASLANQIAGTSSHARKLQAAHIVRELGFPLTVNIVLHRANIGRLEQIISLAENVGAERLELANTQYYGWAFRNLGALLPTRDQVARAAQVANAAKERLSGKMEILFVTPDYYGGRPKPCMNGWGRRYLTINPVGEALPCPNAREINDLHFDNVKTRSLSWIWTESGAFNRFRGTEWMPVPCHDCDFREVDFGGCRCQAALITGRADLTDPACSLSPDHDKLTRLIEYAGANSAGPASFPFMRQNPS